MNSPQANLDLLVARVQKLEVSNRRWRLLNALLLLSGVSVVLMGAKPADRLEPNVIRAASVEAQDFVLKDTAGRCFSPVMLKPSTARLEEANGPPHLVPGAGAAIFRPPPP